jgi:hypothetical protein
MKETATLTVNDTVVDLSGFEASQAIGMLVLRQAFGPSYVAHMCETLGPRPHLVALTDGRQRAVFAALYTDAQEVRERWAARVWPLSVPDAAAILSGDAVIFDYTAVAHRCRGRWPGYFRECCRYLAARGFKTLYSECQILRQVALFRTMGLYLLNPPPYDVRRQVARIGAAWRRHAGGEPDLKDLLFPGETLFFYDDGFFRAGAWNVFLAEPVYIRVPLAVT